MCGVVIPKDKVVSIIEHVVEGNGMRKTGRLLKVDADIVIRYTRLAGKHAEVLHDELVAFSPQHRGGAVRREVGLCVQEKKALRRKQSGPRSLSEYRLNYRPSRLNI